jgi:hypothetical protein
MCPDKTKCYVQTPDNSANKSKAQKELHWQINVMSDSAINLGNLLSTWSFGFKWWMKTLLFLFIITCVGILLFCVYCCTSLVPTCCSLFPWCSFFFFLNVTSASYHLQRIYPSMVTSESSMRWDTCCPH